MSPLIGACRCPQPLLQRSLFRAISQYLPREGLRDTFIVLKDSNRLGLPVTSDFLVRTKHPNMDSVGSQQITLAFVSIDIGENVCVEGDKSCMKVSILLQVFARIPPDDSCDNLPIT